MDKKVLKEYSVKIWDTMNLVLVITAIVFTIAFVALFVACFVTSIPIEKHNLILGMCGVFASLSSAFFIAWVIRFHDLKKKQETEQKALVLIQPYLSTIFSTMGTFLPQIKHFATINSDDTIDYPRETIYYTDLNISTENRSFINLNEAFKRANERINRDLDNCINSPLIFQCNEEIIKLLTSIKQNEFTSNLFEIYKSSSNPYFSNTAFFGLYSDFNNYWNYYETLSKFVSYKPKGELVELSSEERTNYLKEIEAVKKQFPTNHTGEIYRGGIRIQ